MTVGDASACGLTTAGTLWCWGSAAGTVQSDGSIPDASIPTQVGTSADWTDVSAGAYNTCAVKNDGSLWCWGPNYQGQLGNGTTGGPAVYVPTRVGPSTTWASVDVGSGTVCGIRTDGSLWCWGLNRDGEVGDGTTTDRNAPQPVGVGYVWTTVSIGYEHVCAIRADASLWCWGDNSNGAVGDGTTVHRSVPTPVVGGAGWTSVAVGGQHACAVRVDGTQWCWGSNQYGQLGIDASPSAGVSVPTKVVG